MVEKEDSNMCPVRGHNQAMKMSKTETHEVGICICDVPRNRYSGRQVHRVGLVKVAKNTKPKISKGAK